MAPNFGDQMNDFNKNTEMKTKKEWNYFDHIVWKNIFLQIGLHMGAVYGAYLCFASNVKLQTLIFAVFLYHISTLGITAGVHRLWSHRAYKAKLPLRIILGICNSMAFQNSIYTFSRDHRVHHKYTETDADPVNSKRGFFFAHIGWVFCKKHPDVRDIGGKVDLSDVLADPVARLQHEYYIPSVLLFCVLLPTVIPWYYWGETLHNAYFIAFMLRQCLAMNATALVNSAAHMWGHRPYDSKIAPVENLIVSAFMLGEGWHNYHHTFPYDYRHGEWGWHVNMTTFILDQLTKIGWVYDRRIATKEIIEKRKTRTGPNSEKYIPEELAY